MYFIKNIFIDFNFYIEIDNFFKLNLLYNKVVEMKEIDHHQHQCHHNEI